MKTWKQAALALAAAGLLSAQAQATEAQVNPLPVPAFSQVDILAMFEQVDKPVEVVALSSVEMKETEGAWWFAPVVAWTIGGAAVGSVAAWRQNGTVTWRDVGAGATAGFYASPMGRPFGNGGRYVMGTFGSSVWYVNN